MAPTGFLSIFRCNKTGTIDPIGPVHQRRSNVRHVCNDFFLVNEQNACRKINSLHVMVIGWPTSSSDGASTWSGSSSCSASWNWIILRRQNNRASKNWIMTSGHNSFRRSVEMSSVTNVDFRSTKYFSWPFPSLFEPAIKEINQLQLIFINNNVKFVVSFFLNETSLASENLDQKKKLKNSLKTRKMLLFSNCWSTSGQSRFSSGSHEFSPRGYPSHFMKYSGYEKNAKSLLIFRSILGLSKIFLHIMN